MLQLHIMQSFDNLYEMIYKVKLKGSQIAFHFLKHMRKKKIVILRYHMHPSNHFQKHI